MSFTAGLFKGVAEGALGEITKYREDMDARITEASRYHVARAGTQQDRHDKQLEEIQDSLKLLDPFFEGKNKYAQIDAVYRLYGATPEGAAQAAEAGHRALAVARQEDPNNKVDFASLFDFAFPAVSKQDPSLTLDEVINRHVPAFSYDPGATFNTSQTAFGEFIGGDEGKKTSARIFADLEGRGISKGAPLGDVMPSAYATARLTGEGSRLMNHAANYKRAKEEADLTHTQSQITLYGAQAENYTQTALLNQEKVATWSATEQARMQGMLAATALDGEQLAGEIVKNRLLSDFGAEKEQLALDALRNEIKHKYGDKDWEEFDVGLATGVVDLQTQIGQLERARAAPAIINPLRAELSSLEATRLYFLNEHDLTTQMDIVSKSSAPALWQASMSQAFQDAQLSDVVELGLHGEIKKITGDGNKFPVALATYDAYQSYKTVYAPVSDATQMLSASMGPSITRALESEVSAILSSVYRIEKDGVVEWHEGGESGSARTRGDTSQDGKKGQVTSYYSSNYNTTDGTIADRHLKKGQIYKIRASDIDAQLGDNYVQKYLANTKYYNPDDGGSVYGVWAGGTKSGFRFLFSSERAESVR
jgi:hypothetical protein